jgi:pimeloyl-ACP methyl ester carboxylesterase
MSGPADRQTTTISVRGRRIHEIRSGAKPSGRTLLYLHSAMGEATWLAPHLGALADAVELHAPAHPGFLGSEGIDEIADIEDLVFHYLAYLDELGWKSATLMGVSLGGWIAAEIAARYPERVARLVLASSVGIRIPEVPITDIFAIDGRHPEKLREMLFHDVDSPLARMVGGDMTSLPEDFIVNFMNAMAATAKVGWNPLLHDPRLDGLLPRIKAETLVVWGANDRVVPLEYGERFAKRIPGARLAVIADCGHLAPIERTQRFLEIVTPFVA